jgi:hypothetical protein
VIRFDIYLGAGEDNQGVNQFFAVFKTEEEMRNHLEQDFSLLGPAAMNMLEVPPYVSKWRREI